PRLRPAHHAHPARAARLVSSRAPIKARTYRMESGHLGASFFGYANRKAENQPARLFLRMRRRADQGVFPGGKSNSPQ
ncbi:hypothetical protein, partial [Raoultibacter timonensis]|uniref:hypothetical protein n=1 Tax=Raoultibacter timonensis TaxID=1907662 RepID=UPI001CA5E1B4